MTNRWLVLAVLGLACALAAGGAHAGPEAAPKDSLTPLGGHRYRLDPVLRIEEPRLGECSGIAFLDGAWYAHNDSGDEPVIYRAADPSFRDAEVLPVPGATAVDWEALTVHGDDLLVCDVGDNFRNRSDVAVYRVRYVPPAGDQPARADLVATYPVAYPDGRHDCEAAFVKDDRLHLVLKNRGEEATWVYRFDTLQEAAALAPDRRNVPTRLAPLALPAGEQATAAAYDAVAGALVVLTYAQVLTWAETLAGPPTRTTTLHARQCEAACLHEGDLWFANEQRDVYRIAGFLGRRVDEALPAVPHPRLPECPASAPRWTPLPLSNLLAGDEVSAAVSPTHLSLRGALALTRPFAATTTSSPRLGSGVLVGFSAEGDRQLGRAQRVLAVVFDEERAAHALDMPWGDPQARPTPATGVGVRGRATEARITFEIDIPRAWIGDARRWNVLGVGLRPQAQGSPPSPPILAGFDSWSFLRPFVWSPFEISEAE